MSSQCGSCGAAVKWVKTAKGKNMPVNASSWEEGDTLFDSKKHRSHFATCPQAAKHRRRVN